MSIDTKVHEEMKELQRINRELRKTVNVLKKSKEGWKKKLFNKQYQLKVQENTTLAAKTSRDNWQKKCVLNASKLTEELSDNEKKEKDLKALLDAQKKENEKLKKELEEKKSL